MVLVEKVCEPFTGSHQIPIPIKSARHLGIFDLTCPCTLAGFEGERNSKPPWSATNNHKHFRATSTFLSTMHLRLQMMRRVFIVVK